MIHFNTSKQDPDLVFSLSIKLTGNAVIGLLLALGVGSTTIPLALIEKDFQEKGLVYDVPSTSVQIKPVGTT